MGFCRIEFSSSCCWRRYSRIALRPIPFFKEDRVLRGGLEGVGFEGDVVIVIVVDVVVVDDDDNDNDDDDDDDDEGRVDSEVEEEEEEEVDGDVRL